MTMSVEHDRMGQPDHLGPHDGRSAGAQTEATRVTNRRRDDRPTTTSREAAWVAGIHNGDDDLFAEAFRAHVTPLVRYAHRYVHSEAVAQDIVMDVFLRLWRDRQQLPLDLKLAAYLGTAVHNTALNVLARGRVEHSWRRRGTYEGWSPAMSAPIRTADEEIERAEAKEVIRQAYLSLPERLRQVIELRWFQGKSYQEIGRELGISSKSVDNYLAKAMRMLRQTIRGESES